MPLSSRYDIGLISFTYLRAPGLANLDIQLCEVGHLQHNIVIVVKASIRQTFTKLQSLSQKLAAYFNFPVYS